jgi:hypothetical protein
MYEDKFIAFVDILGFKELVDRSETTVEYILELTGRFGSSTEEDFARYGPTTCPCAPHIAGDLNFRVTQISDCAVISAEESSAGLINLVHHCYKIAFRFLKVGHLCRGYITRGKIYHTDTQFFGPGYQRAYERENKVSTFQRHAADTGTPFIEIDPEVCSYVAEQTDSCVRTVFGRLTERDGKSAAISPFFALKAIPDIVIDKDSDFAVCKGQVQIARDNILRLLSQLEKQEASLSSEEMQRKIAEDRLERDRADARIRRKIEHIKRKLREVLALKDKQAEMIDLLSQPLSQRFPL